MRETLIEILRDPGASQALSPSRWTALVACARETNLLGSLAERLYAARLGTGCNADRHLMGARQLSERQRRSVRWEAQCLSEALEKLAIPVVLLKGTGYVLGQHPNALGRLFGDVDILVPQEALGAVEVRLMVNGWTVAKNDAYDQRYYREWMHELPPMLHVRRGTMLDVHHTILPPTARHTPSPQRIIDRSRAIEGLTRLRVPCVEDLVIHSITHLVHEGELHNGLRDLYDIHTLIETQEVTEGFWRRLLDYTREHELASPVCLGLRLVKRFFGTAIPELVELELSGGRGPSAQETWLMGLYDWALATSVNSRTPANTSLARSALYIRAHWLRMPPRLLVRHLSRKAWKQLKGPEAAPQME